MPKSPPQATQNLPVFLRHHSDFFVNAFLVRVAMPMPNSRCCFAMQVKFFYCSEGPLVLCRAQVEPRLWRCDWPASSLGLLTSKLADVHTVVFITTVLSPFSSVILVLSRL